MPLSGALTYLKGDVYPPWMPDFPWCVEAKNHKEVEWNNLLTAKTNSIIEFWNQAEKQANIMKKRPLLVYKWDRSKIHCCWSDNLVVVDKYIEINVLATPFKMALFEDWLNNAKQVFKK